MTSDFGNRTLLHIELPRSTQSFENMLDEIPQTPDNLTRTKTASTTFSDLLHLTGNNNREEIDTADKETGDQTLISDGNSFSDDSICTACTQCKLAKRLNGACDKKVSSISECDGLSLFVDQINCETEVEGRENHPKRSSSDTLTSRFVPEYSSKRFKLEGFGSDSQLPSNSARGIIEPKETSASYCHGRSLPGEEAPSEPAKLCDDNHINVQKELLEASANPDEHSCEQLAQIDNSVDQGTALSHTLEGCDSTITQSNIEGVGFEDETKDDDPKNAAPTLEYQILSPSPTVSTFSQSTIEEIYYIDATDEIDCPNSIKIAERPLQDSEERGETAIDLVQVDAGLDNVEKQRIERNPEDLGCMKSLENGNEENNEENFKTEGELGKEILNLATEIGNHGPDIDSSKNEEINPSILEVSIDSSKTYIEMNSLDKRGEKATVNKKRVSTEDPMAGNSKELERRDDFGSRKATDVTNPVLTFQDPLENFAPITEAKKSSKDVDDTSLDFLSESELERIEKEAYTKSKRIRIATNLRNPNVGEEDRFYRPQGVIANTENNEDLVLPNWVTNPAPEPDYEMMRRRKRSQKEYINKILQEVLRLSEIISKVGKAVREASTSTESRDLLEHNGSNIPHSVEPAAGNRSDIFYAPQSLGRPKRDEPPNLSNNVGIHRPVKLEATVNTVDRNRANCSAEIRESEKLYVPRSGGSKYDASFIFGRQKDELNIGKASCSDNNAEASSFYNPSINSGSSKRDWSGNTRTSRESQLPKESFQASFVSDTRYKTGNIDGMNDRKTVGNKDGVFYSSDNLTSASRKYTKLPSVENGQIFFSKSLVSERFRPDSIQAKPTSLNFGCNPTARTNESVFYSGNK